MLYFVPTPIGNLSDISAHALDILSRAEVAICEDTRVSKQLLNLLSQKFDTKFNVGEFYSLHTHNESEFFSKFDTEISLSSISAVTVALSASEEDAVSAAEEASEVLISVLLIDCPQEANTAAGAIARAISLPLIIALCLRPFQA